MGLDPFVDAQGEKSYFVTPALHQRIELVRHLLEFGRQIVVVTGSQGTGKSVLLESVSDPAGKNWRVLRYDAGPALNQQALLSKVANELGIDHPASGGKPPLETIRTRVQAIHQRGENIVLAIDDAHRLPADTAACIATLAHCADESAEIKVVLSADSAQSTLVDKLQSESSRHTLVHVVELPPLTNQQIEAMLIHRWNVAYGNENIPLDPAEMTQISQASNGNPGKAIVLARQVLIPANSARPPPPDPAKQYLIGGVAVIVLFIVVAFFSADESVNTQETQIDLKLSTEPIAQSPPISPIRERDARSAVGGAPDLVNSESAITAKTAGELIELIPSVDPQLPHVSPTPPDISLPDTVPTAPIVTPTLPTAAPVAPIIQDSTTREPTSPVLETPANSARVKVTIEPPAAASQKPVPTERYSIEWLRTRAAGGYVLQLFGVRDRMMAVKFIKDRKIHDKSAVLVTQHAGAPWYVVVYGYYPDRAAAQAAIPNLQANLAATEPWARPIASLE
jgi:DamX protein